MKGYGLSRPYHSNFCEGCLPQILLGPFLNTLPNISVHGTETGRVKVKDKIFGGYYYCISTSLFQKKTEFTKMTS